MGGNQVWLVVGAGAWLLHRARERREPRPVWTEELAPGDAVTITHHRRPD